MNGFIYGVVFGIVVKKTYPFSIFFGSEGDTGY